MAQNVPLMSDQDYELGRDLPNYEQAILTRQQGMQQNEKQEPKIDGRSGAGHFWSELGHKRPVNGQFGNLFANHLRQMDNEGAVAFAHLSIRLGFLRKVLGILAFQFVATFILCTAFYMTDGVKTFIQEQPWFLFASLFGSLGLLFAMFVYARTTPINYFLLGAWTILQAVTIGAVVSFYDVSVVLQAVFLTGVVVVSLFVYTLQSKRDFQKHYAALFSISLLFLAATMIQMLVMSSTFNFVMSLTGAALFSVYLVFDIDMITHHYSEEDYIIACISIYMDIMGLFLRILEILNELNRN